MDDPVFSPRRTKHGQQSGQREQIQTEISEELPEPHSQGKRDAQWIESGGDVVAKEFGVAQQEARLRGEGSVPPSQRHDPDKYIKHARASALRGKNILSSTVFPYHFLQK